MNVVTGEEGFPAAVLLRAGEPVEGCLHSTRGPGNLCRALAIRREHDDGRDLDGDDLFLLDAPPPAERILAARRVNVDYAGPWAEKPWRYALEGNRWVSRPPLAPAPGGAGAPRSADPVDSAGAPPRRTGQPRARPARRHRARGRAPHRRRGDRARPPAARGAQRPAGGARPGGRARHARATSSRWRESTRATAFAGTCSSCPTAAAWRRCASRSTTRTTSSASPRQAGCALGCAFCATGALGLVRSLASWEIVRQVQRVRADSERPVTGVVFMGQGEPFQNYEAVLDAAYALCDPSGARIDARRISISTAGVVPMIHRYTAEGHKFRLCVSLNAALPEKRRALMPIERGFPLPELAEAIREHAARRGRITIEYVMISGVNVGRRGRRGARRAAARHPGASSTRSR